MGRGLLAALGLVMGLFGGLFFALFLTTFASGGDGKTEAPVYVGLIVFFGGMTAAGLYLAWRMFRPVAASFGATRPGTGATGSAPRPASRPTPAQPAGPPRPAPPATAAERERRVLRLVEAEHGRVTIPEVAVRCGMTIEESKLELDRMVLHGVAQIHVTENGVLVYVFSGFMSDEEKAQAQDI